MISHFELPLLLLYDICVSWNHRARRRTYRVSSQSPSWRPPAPPSQAQLAVRDFPTSDDHSAALPCHHTTILFLSCSWTLSIVTARGVPPSIILSQQPSLDSCVLFLPLVLLGSAFSVVVIGCNLAACRSSTHSFFGNLWTPYNHRVSQIFLFV